MSEHQSSFGRSLIVPSVQELWKQGIAAVPTRYLRSDHHHHHPPPDNLVPAIPVIDVQALLSPDHHHDQLQKLHSACLNWGFFQVVNHGVAPSLMENFRAQVIAFFQLPIEEKKKLWQQPDNQEGFGQLFVVSEEQKLDWSDMFLLTTLPLCRRNTALFQKLPPMLRDTLEAYIIETKKLATTLLGQMAKALNIADGEMQHMFRDGVQTLRMNYYPPCPQPDKAIGLTPHSDADALTILYPLNDTKGLEIKNNGEWVPVEPSDGAFIVNLGDVMEIISNGVYKSIEHRVLVNSSKERLSVATFYIPNVESELGPAQSLLGHDNPPVFGRITVEEYLKQFFARKLYGKSNLDFIKLDSAERQVLSIASVAEMEAEPIEKCISLEVPSVQELAKKKLSAVPSRYIRRHQHPPHPPSPAAAPLPEIPVIDLQKLLCADDSELQRLHSACQEWGFFQVINHGVDSAAIEKIKMETQKFFDLPIEEKKKLQRKEGELQGYGQVFVMDEETRLDWGDRFYVVTSPQSLRSPPLLSNLSPTFRNAIETYSSELKLLAIKILKQMAKALNMKEEEMETLFEEGVQSARISYYPPCPQPDLVLGFSPHSDANALTILLHANGINGLQVNKDGVWIPVAPLPNSFTVNIGDILEARANLITRNSSIHCTCMNSCC
ncbi:protein SRG1-like [Andrographis paniculata]|uniref:protein SRG1-like n=1 Tax=Andrographis paniculata TaxID=175694 RepID=UPI0021E95EF0|nr:protein SRG1-like [Andrographis paniculata]